MVKRVLRSNWSWTYLLLFALLVVSIVGLLQPGGKKVAAADEVCKAAIVLDRSGSVQDAGLRTMKDQVSRLFQAPSIEVNPTTGGLYTDKIQLAFWTFANLPDGSNYNAPFNGFVSSKGTNSSFNTNLNSVTIPPPGQNYTNYMHGMGYVGNQINNKDGMEAIIRQADVIVFMTDGEPNKPSQPANSAATGVSEFARNAGRAAAKKHLDAGQVLLGGFIQGQTSAANGHKEINFLINGDNNNSANTFDVNSSYNNLAQQLKTQIGARCDVVPHPCPINPSITDDDPVCKPPERTPYSLIPRATTNESAISGNEGASFQYKVENQGTTADSDATNWTIRRVAVQRGQDTTNLTTYANNASYMDGTDCNTLKARGGSGAECSDISSGTRVFGRNSTTTLVPAEVGTASTLVLDDKWPVGTKLCYVLTIAKPTQNDTPKDRASTAACVVVGKRPTFQVLGGDVVAGRYFAGDTQNTSLSDVRGSLTTKSGQINKTFGSWVEYGIFAPGIVSGVASSSGLQGGYEGAVASNQELWSKLTFANTNGAYGKYTSANGMGMATNMADYFVRGQTPVRDLTSTDATIAFNGTEVTNGLYRKLSGDLAIDGSTLEKGKAVIVQVPNGTVTINGDLLYGGGPYTSIGEIPQLVIIAKNITIKSTVSTVNAWLLAQDSEGRGGTLMTCDLALPLTADMCNAPLTVNGPVVAKDVQLRRTGGSGAGQASGDPAEVFNLRADAYLWGYNEGRSAVRAETTYTTELPPQF